MTAYALYNEIDDYAADWLENLIKADLIAPGIVDRRSIEDLRGDDLRGFRQVHFFAGIGIWSYALRRAGVSDDTALWTGSCPCQPFSAAGKGGGVDDERHLWPAFLHLIRECGPDRVLGEQVASKDGLGWLDLVQTDMEAEGYALGPVDTCSAGSGAPHIRQRLRFYAYDPRSATSGLADCSDIGFERSGRPWGRRLGFANDSAVGRLDHHHHQGLEGFGRGPKTESGRDGALRPIAETGEFGGLADYDRLGQHSSPIARLFHAEHHTQPCNDIDGMADAGSGQFPKPFGRKEGRDGNGPDRSHARPGPTNGFWRDADWVFCRDEKWRPVESGTFPLADGTAFRVDSGSPFAGKSRQGMLKAFGNAIDAEATVDFIKACLAFRPDDGVAARSLSLEDLLV
ncbi:DNA cytosine methyltransferase [Mesorhizobium sp. M0859]|uniref:DNA cytosine methyltransferase n=1 Tax=Mesorhizobium sp. M0859 TaxID=2957014 RepID=UPI00333A6C06